MGVDQQAIAELIAGVYDCALDPDGWEEALEQFRALMGARLTATLLSGTASGEIVAGSGLTDEMRITYRDHFGKIDPVSNTIARMPSGVVASALEMRDLPAWEREEFYNDWARPHAVGEFIAATYGRSGDSVRWFVVSAPWGKPDYASEERVRIVRMVLPHMERAARIGDEVGLISARLESALDALSNIGHSVFLLAHHGEVLVYNAAAEAQLAARDGLALSRTGRLCAVDPRDDARLAHVVERAIHQDAEGVRSAGWATVSRPSRRRPYFVRVSPLGRTARGDEHRPSAIAIVLDPGETRSPTADALRELFRLTPAEISVALAVVRGGGLQHVAELLHVSLSTVRIHLQHAFEKTGTHSQVELTALLSSLA